MKKILISALALTLSFSVFANGFQKRIELVDRQYVYSTETDEGKKVIANYAQNSKSGRLVKETIAVINQIGNVNTPEVINVASNLLEIAKRFKSIQPENKNFILKGKINLGNNNFNNIISTDSVEIILVNDSGEEISIGSFFPWTSDGVLRNFFAEISNLVENKLTKIQAYEDALNKLNDFSFDGGRQARSLHNNSNVSDDSSSVNSL